MQFEPFMQFIRGITGRRLHSNYGGIQNTQQMAYLRYLQKEINRNNFLDTPFQQLNVVVFDIETTGFYPNRGDVILSIGATKVRGTTIKKEGTFYSLVSTEKRIPENIVQLTGITNEHIKDAPNISEVLIQFLEYANDSILVAHHSNHERSFMHHVSQQYFKTSFKHRIIDTSLLYKVVEPNLQNIPLEQLCMRHGIPIINRHHALGDAILTAKIWSIYVTKVMELGCDTLNDVYSYLGRR